ncbi:MAG: D-alanine--D-alanine ligase [Alphaproteobacteria bacterium]|nr:D-alanine--D-alanine ligase [Alphaproteobacteria bacterium]
MHFGFTYDLRKDYLAEGYSEEETAEFDSQVTIDGIASALEAMGHKVTRIGHMRHLAKRLTAGERWDMVFNIAEGLAGFGREAQVPALLDAFGIPYTFSDPLTSSVTLHKAMAKAVVRHGGVATPDWALVEDEADIDAVNLPFPLFAKPVAEGTGKGVTAASKCADAAALKRTCQALLAKHRQPVLVETYLPGREFTIGILGTGKQAEALGVMEILFNDKAEAHGYSYINKETYEDKVEYRLVEGAAADAIAQAALTAWRLLGCRDGGRMDFRLAANGAPHFLEVNPLAGLNPERSDMAILCRLLGVPYQELIKRIVLSACERLSSKATMVA